jgi:hypothetical protein
MNTVKVEGMIKKKQRRDKGMKLKGFRQVYHVTLIAQLELLKNKQ